MRALTLVLGMVNTTAVFQAYLKTYLLTYESLTKIGWVFNINLFFKLFCGLYVGDVFGRRVPRLLVGLGSFALVASIMLLGTCECEAPLARLLIR
jgi:osomolarity two-component system sensor histidine kinase SLN1